MTRIEDVLAEREGLLGADWGGTHSLRELIAQDRVRVALRDNGLLLEVLRGDGSVGVYELAHAPVADRFL